MICDENIRYRFLTRARQTESGRYIYELAPKGKKIIIYARQGIKQVIVLNVRDENKY